MNRPGPRTRSPQLRRQPVGTVLGTDEEQCAPRTLGNPAAMATLSSARTVNARWSIVDTGVGVGARRAAAGRSGSGGPPCPRRCPASPKQHALLVRPSLVQQRRDRRQEAQICHEIGFVENCDLDVSEHSPRSMRSRRRPGVAITTSTPRRSESICRPMGALAVDGGDAHGQGVRVERRPPRPLRKLAGRDQDESTGDRGRLCPWWSRASMAMPAKVFPEPVWLRARMSRPECARKGAGLDGER